MDIDYDHSSNLHSINGAKVALPILLGAYLPASLLDIGCGLGTWLKAALDLGISDVLGVDGVVISPETYLGPKHLFAQHDLAMPLRLGRRFDVAICLEVAEHLEPEAAKVLVTSLTKHADTIFFSAACPNQPGQHHINCQWPSYWQSIFNSLEFACDDAVRWLIWSDSRIEPWYRQNMFVAKKNVFKAGKEPRIMPVIHPDMVPDLSKDLQRKAVQDNLNKIEAGLMSVHWYVQTVLNVAQAKMKRKFL